MRAYLQKIDEDIYQTKAFARLDRYLEVLRNFELHFIHHPLTLARVQEYRDMFVLICRERSHYALGEKYEERLYMRLSEMVEEDRVARGVVTTGVV